MNKVSFMFISIIMLLTACQTANSDAITLEEVLASFEKQQLSLKESKASDQSILGMKLNSVKPSSYELAGKKLYIYIYDSTKEREKGLEEFHTKTAAASLVSYHYYEVKNVSIFYVHELDRRLKVEAGDEIQGALRDLDKK